MNETEWLVKLLDEAFDGPAWHGPSLSGAVRGIDARGATWRPAPDRHCIWQIVLHCAYWKHRVRRRLAPDAAAKFPRRGRDWPGLPAEPDARAWAADLELLRIEHEGLLRVVAALPADALHAPAAGHRAPAIEHIRGIALHDTYHAGQIRLLRRLEASHVR